MQENQNTSTRDYRKEIHELKEALCKRNRTIEKLNAEVMELKGRLQSKSLKTHNERGAGRKSIITSDMKAAILDLRKQGLSLAKIAETYSQKAGVKVSKSTVYKIISKQPKVN